MTQTSEISTLIADIKEQVLYLWELGVENLDAVIPEIVGSRLAAKTSPNEERYAPPEIFKINAPLSKPSETKTAAVSRLSNLPSLAKRQAAVPSSWSGTDDARETIKQTETLFGDIAPTLPEPVETIPEIRAEIGPDCSRCPLHALGRRQVVNSVGNFKAELMFVGEAPGADEDEQGEPFVGRAGQLLTKIIEGIGLKREDVFIGNINRCRPPGNRQPVPVETEACRPFLLREIAVVRPKVIVVLGNTATQNLLDIKTPISKLRGNFQDYFGVKVMPTFHPAYLLRDPHKKREVWEDMKKVRDYLKSF